MNRKTDPKYKPRTLSGRYVKALGQVPTWGELVAQGPKSDPDKAAVRAARRAELAGRSIRPPDPPKRQQHGVKSVREGWHGRLVQHPAKPVAPSEVAPHLQLTRTERKRAAREVS